MSPSVHAVYRYAMLNVKFGADLVHTAPCQSEDETHGPALSDNRK
jgi:hypothetical protein